MRTSKSQELKRAGKRYVYHSTDIRLYLTILLIYRLYLRAHLRIRADDSQPDALLYALQQHHLYPWILYNLILNPHRQLCPGSLEGLRKRVPVSRGRIVV